MAGGDDPRGRGRGAGRGRGRGGGGRGRNSSGRGRGRGGGRGDYHQSNQRAVSKSAQKVERTFEEDDEGWEQVNKHRAARVAPSQTSCAAELASSLAVSPRLHSPCAQTVARRSLLLTAAAAVLLTARRGPSYQYLGDLMAMGYAVRCNPRPLRGSFLPVETHRTDGCARRNTRDTLWTYLATRSTLHWNIYLTIRSRSRRLRRLPRRPRSRSQHRRRRRRLHRSQSQTDEAEDVGVEQVRPPAVGEVEPGVEEALEERRQRPPLHQSRRVRPHRPAHGPPWPL